MATRQTRAGRVPPMPTFKPPPLPSDEEGFVRPPGLRESRTPSPMPPTERPTSVSAEAEKTPTGPYLSVPAKLPPASSVSVDATDKVLSATSKKLEAIEASEAVRDRRSNNADTSDQFTNKTAADPAEKEATSAKRSQTQTSVPPPPPPPPPPARTSSLESFSSQKSNNLSPSTAVQVAEKANKQPRIIEAAAASVSEAENVTKLQSKSKENDRKSDPATVLNGGGNKTSLTASETQQQQAVTNNKKKVPDARYEPEERKVFDMTYDPKEQKAKKASLLKKFDTSALVKLHEQRLQQSEPSTSATSATSTASKNNSHLLDRAMRGAGANLMRLDPAIIYASGSATLRSLRLSEMNITHIIHASTKEEAESKSYAPPPSSIEGVALTKIILDENRDDEAVMEKYLHEAANLIQDVKAKKKGGTIMIHTPEGGVKRGQVMGDSRRGEGVAAALIAAYFIKYAGKSSEEALDIFK